MRVPLSTPQIRLVARVDMILIELLRRALRSLKHGASAGRWHNFCKATGTETTRAITVAALLHVLTPQPFLPCDPWFTRVKCFSRATFKGDSGIQLNCRQGDKRLLKLDALTGSSTVVPGGFRHGAATGSCSHSLTAVCESFVLMCLL